MPVRMKQCSGPCQTAKFIGEFWKDGKQPDGHMSRCIECTKEAREIRAEARANGEEIPRVTEARRQELQRQARQMHAEGRLGGPEYGRLGGRPRKTRIVDHVIDHFRSDSMVELIVRAYESNLRAHSKPQRLRAAEALVAMESRDEELKAKLRGAGKRPEDMDEVELREFLEQGLAGMIERGEIDVEGLNGVITLPDGAARVVA